MDEIIVISDDENEYSLTLNDSSVILEDFGPAVSEQQCRNEEIVDEESGLSVTYSKRGDVLPHARYDCAVHPFSFSDNHMCTPMENNMTFCEQCYCYICGKLASECLSWITPSICHCNAHKRSAYWKMEREKASLGILFEFHFDLLEIDADLQEAGCILHRFEDNLNKEYTKFLLGIKATIHSHGTCKCSCHTKRKKNSSCTLCSSGHMEIISYDYSGVHDLAYKLVCEAEERKPKVAAVLLLGIAKQIMLHKQPMANWQDGRDDRKCATTAVSLLLTRITDFLQMLFVSSDFTSFFSKKLMQFFQSLYFPVNCRYFVNRLNIFLWDDPLLVAVLKGQNVSGTRIVKGKKKVLFECLNVIQARKKKLLEQHKYRELARYLKAVKSENTLHMQNLLDEIPFYMCKCGDFNSAAESLFSARYPFCCTACRLSPVQFIVYLKILLSGQVPAGNEVDDSGKWETIQGTTPLKKSFVVKIALQTLSCNNQLFTDPESWEALITATCSSHKLTREGNFQCIAYKKPDEEFIQRHGYLSMKLVEELKMRQNFVYPQCFHDARYRDEALLLLVTEALMKMPYNDFPVLLNIVLAFRENMWALKYLLDGLNETLLNQFIYCLEMDLYRHSNILLTRLSPNDPQVLGDFIFFFLSQEHYLLWPIGNMIQDILLKNWTVHQNYYWQNHLHCKMNKQNPSHISQ